MDEREYDFTHPIHTCKSLVPFILRTSKGHIQGQNRSLLFWITFWFQGLTEDPEASPLAVIRLPGGMAKHRKRGKHSMSKTTLVSAALLILTFSLSAADKSPKQILEGKPAATHSSTSRYFDGKGASAGRSVTSGNQTRIYTSTGKSDGRVDASKNGTRVYDSKGAFAGRTSTSGNTTQFYDAKGRSAGRSVTTGNQTRYYDSKGASTGRATTSSGTTRFYDGSGRSVGSRRK